MINNKKILAIIPARGGSKRLPRKNILPLLGKPLIQWTSDAALASKYIDTVMVSTDSKEIVEISESCGVSTPYLRSDVLSNDVATSIDVVLDVLENYENNNQLFDLVMLLQPTSPLRKCEDIDEAVELFIEKSAHAVVSVAECDHSPLWSNTLPSDFNLSNFISNEVLNKRSQDLPVYYRLNGAIYIFDVEKIRKNSNYLSSPNTFGFVMSKNRSVDIDDEFDFYLAESIIRNT
jgi:CMP-N-acetylneuraminic acid synthetase